MTYKLLTLSNLYPNSAMPRNGIFTEHRMRNMLKSGRVELKVVVPVPWVPTGLKKMEKYANFARVPATDLRHGIEIIYPRFPAIPKIGMTLSPLLLALSLIRPLRRIIKAGFDFDAIDAYYFYPDGVAAAMLGWYFRKPVIITAYGNDISLIPQHFLPRLQIQWAAGRAAGITAVCAALKDRLAEFGVPRGKMHVVIHGVDLEMFHPPQDRDALRKKFGLNKHTLLSVGHLIERKGHHIPIEALTLLPDMDLLIAGDGEEEGNLKTLAQRLGVADRVRFLGHVNQEELPDYYGAVDALVLASSREGIANVLIESMACATPVIATNVWGSPEAVTSPAAGVLMQERSATALRSAVTKLFDNYPARSDTRLHSEQFTWERTTKDHLALLDFVLR